MPRKKTTKDPIAVLKQKLNKAINDKNTILREFEGEEEPLLYHYRKYKKTKHIRNKRGWKAYSTVKNLSTKIKKLSKQLQDIHNNASADTILRDTNAADHDMHAVSEVDESIGSYTNSIIPLPPFVNEQLFRGSHYSYGFQFVL